MREAIIIGAIVGLFFFAGGAILTALAIKNATDSFLWDAVLWGGITAMIASIATLALYISSQLSGRAFLEPSLFVKTCYRISTTLDRESRLRKTAIAAAVSSRRRI